MMSEVVAAVSAFFSSDQISFNSANHICTYVHSQYYEDASFSLHACMNAGFANIMKYFYTAFTNLLMAI